jgi:hypothetical protein
MYFNYDTNFMYCQVYTYKVLNNNRLAYNTHRLL